MPVDGEGGVIMSLRWSVEELKRYCNKAGRPLPEGLPAEDKKTKYGNRKVSLDGYEFDSQKEANRYCELKLLERAGMISDLKVHPVYVVWEGFRRGNKWYRDIKMELDFEYIESGKKVVEDVKVDVTKTRPFRIKLKLFTDKYPDIEFRIYE